MNIIRMAIGAGLFLASSLASLFMSDVLGMPETLSFLTVGGMLAFLGGIVFYSGVKECSYRF